MAGVFHKAMVWLGLAPDDEYDDYPYDPGMRSGPAPRQPMPQQRPGPHPQQRPPGQGRPYPQQAPPQYGYEEEGFVSPRNPQGRPSGTVRQLGPRGQGPVDPRDQHENPTVRPMRPTAVKPIVLAPVAFEDAKDIADRFKAEQPVVMDLTGADRDLLRRLLDFSSGICYALGGSMEKLRQGTYLLTPATVEVSDEERRRLSGR